MEGIEAGEAVPSCREPALHLSEQSLPPEERVVSMIFESNTTLIFRPYLSKVLKSAVKLV